MEALSHSPVVAEGLPLPPLTLPPRQLKKIEVSCKKWLTRFLLTLAAASCAHKASAALQDKAAAVADEEKDIESLIHHVCFPAASSPRGEEIGFVALNGGILAGCTPFEVRATLLRHGLVQPPPSPAEEVLHFSSTLPFVLCTRPLALATSPRAEDMQDSCELSALHVSVSEVHRYAASAGTLSEAGQSTSSLPNDVAEASKTKTHEPTLFKKLNTDATSAEARPSASAIGVAVLQLPPNASLWKGGSSTAASSSTTSSSSSSANKGCGFLYLLPCNAAVVRRLLARAWQKPVVGIDRLLPSLSGGVAMLSEKGTTKKEVSHPRTCVSLAVPHIPGLYVVEDFLSKEEEAAIWQELHEDRQRLRLEYLSRRRVAHFNRRFIYGKNQLTDEGQEVNARPSFYDWMRGRLQNSDPFQSVQITGDFPFGRGDYECDQLTVNYYDYSEMGACGIATHVDAHNAFEDAILIVSLGSYTVMDFARWDSPAEVAAPCGVYLPPRSLVVMSGESRYGWTHCIAEKRTDTVSELVPTLMRGDRMSLTWRRGRRQRHAKATCPFPALCDGED